MSFFRVHKYDEFMIGSFARIFIYKGKTMAFIILNGFMNVLYLERNMMNAFSFFQYTS